jgi:hypothetical protein
VVTFDDVVVVVVSGLEPLPDDVLVPAAVEGAVELIRPAEGFVLVVVTVEPFDVPLVVALHELPPLPAHPPVTSAPVVVVVLPPATVPEGVAVVVVFVPDVPAAGVEVVTVVTRPDDVAAKAPPAVSENTSAAAMWAGESVFMVFSWSIDRLIFRSREAPDVCPPA